MKGGEALTGPMWMAIPPEVHSVLLSAGQGAESLLVAATQWQELSKQYTYAAAELTRLLTHVQATSWRGTSATRFVAAHGAYLVWLEQTSINNAITAKQHEIAAIAYSSALAAMPTLAELTANRATRGFLIATNFFGINTIPIALNEADYVRMWVQAADTMATYQAISEAVTATILPTQVAPPILAPGSATQNVLQSVPDWIVQLLTDILDFIADPYKYFLRFFQRLGFRPAIAVVLAIIALQLYDFLWYPYYASYGMLLLPFFAPALSVLGTLSVLWNGQLSAGLPPNPAGSHPDNNAGPRIHVGVAPPASATSSGNSYTSNSAPSTSASATTDNPLSSPSIRYAIPGLSPPEVSSGPKAGTKSPDTATNTIGITAAARTNSPSARAHRKRGNKTRGGARGYRYEFVEGTATMADTVDAPDHSEPTSHTISNHSAGPIGFAGTVPTTASTPTGMAASTSSSVPLLPTTWITGTSETAVHE